MKIVSYEECIKELSNIITDAPNDILLSFEDIDNIAKDKDLLVMGISKSSGPYVGKKAIESIVSDFEENELSLEEVDGILVSFKIHINYPIIELGKAMETLFDKLSEVEPSVIWGTSCDNTMKEDCIKATVLISYSKQRRGM